MRGSGALPFLPARRHLAAPDTPLFSAAGFMAATGQKGETNTPNTHRTKLEIRQKGRQGEQVVL